MFDDTNEYWKALARKYGVRMPRSGTLIKTGFIESWLRKLEITRKDYLVSTGMLRLSDFARLNPSWDLHGFVGLLLEMKDEGSRELLNDEEIENGIKERNARLKIGRSNSRGRRNGIKSKNYSIVAARIAAKNAICYACNQSDAEQVDHVLSVALAKIFGLLDEVDEYVAPICIDCHRIKTVADNRDIRKFRKQIA